MSAEHRELIAQGDTLWETGRPEAALSAYVAAYGSGAQAKEAALERLLCWTLSMRLHELNADGAWSAVAATARAARTLEPGQPRFLIEEFFGHWLSGTVDSALQVLQTVIADHPHELPMLLSRLGQFFASEATSEAANQLEFDLARLMRICPDAALQPEITARLSATPAREFPLLLVLGMHRSGTSMLTAMLSQLGGWLGPESRLAAGQFDNPEGFFEQVDYVAINDDVLSARHAAWDAPPEGDARAIESLPELFGLESRARALLRSMNRSAPPNAKAIVLKDPRALLTLEFWVRQRTQLRSVLIVRDPHEVAESLQARGGYASSTHGLRLWGSYHRQLMTAPMSRPPIVVIHSRLIAEPVQVLADLANQLNWSVTPDNLNAAAGVYRPDLVHQKNISARANQCAEEYLYQQWVDADKSRL